jgi:hypothetical protein
LLTADDKYDCKHLLTERRFNGFRLTDAVLGSIFGAMLNEAIAKQLILSPYKARTYRVDNFRANMKIPLPLPDFGKYCLNDDIFERSKHI